MFIDTVTEKYVPFSIRSDFFNFKLKIILFWFYSEQFTCVIRVFQAIFLKSVITGSMSRDALFLLVVIYFWYFCQFIKWSKVIEERRQCLLLNELIIEDMISSVADTQFQNIKNSRIIKRIVFVGQGINERVLLPLIALTIVATMFAYATRKCFSKKSCKINKIGLMFLAVTYKLSK